MAAPSAWDSPSFEQLRPEERNIIQDVVSKVLVGDPSSLASLLGSRSASGGGGNGGNTAKAGTLDDMRELLAAEEELEAELASLSMRQSASQHPARPAPAPASRQGSAATSRQASGTVGAAPQHPSVPPSAAATPAAQTFGFPIEYRGERSSDMFVNAGTKTTGPANAKGAAAGSSGNNAPGHHTQPRSEAQRAADASGLLHRVYGGIKALSPVKPVDKKASPRSRSSNQAPANKKQQQQPASDTRGVTHLFDDEYAAKPQDAPLRALYKRAVLWKRWKTQRAQRQADAEKDVELAECTFHPAINQVSAKIIEAMGPHDEDMGEFYKRTVLWKKWREETNLRLSRDRQREESQECTFRPQLNETSKKIVQDGPRYPLKDLAAMAAQATPAAAAAATTGNRRSKSAPRGRSPSPLPRSARGSSHDGEGPAYQTPMYATYTIRNDPAIASARGAAAGAGAGMGMAVNGGDVDGVSGVDSEALAAASAQMRACARLYSLGLQHLGRREELQRLRDQLAQEGAQWTAPRNPVNKAARPRVYQHLAPHHQGNSPTRRKEAAIAAEMEECTFFPQTNPRSKTPGRFRASSAADPFRASSEAGASSRHYAGSAHSGRSRTPQPPRVNDDLNFNEFLDRQQRFLMAKAVNVEIAAEAAAGDRRPAMAPGTARILQAQAAAAARSQTPPPGRERDQYDKAVRSKSAPKRRPTGEEDVTFRPQITRMAQRMRPRSVEQLSEGDRLKKEAWLEQQRLLSSVAELEGVTFQPALNTHKKAYADVQPRVNLRQPELYMAELEYKRQVAEEVRHHVQREREMEELQECTFHPRTTKLPAYLAGAPTGYVQAYLQNRFGSLAPEEAAAHAAAFFREQAAAQAAAAQQQQQQASPRSSGGYSGYASPSPRGSYPYPVAPSTARSGSTPATGIQYPQSGM